MKTGLTEEGLGSSYYGDVHFSTDCPWRKDLFQTIAIHELGHKLDPYLYRPAMINANGPTLFENKDPGCGVGIVYHSLGIPWVFEFCQE